jgi:hypothetical protein
VCSGIDTNRSGCLADRCRIGLDSPSPGCHAGTFGVEGSVALAATRREFGAVTLQHIEALYRRLGVTLTPDDVVGASHYNPDLADVVNELTQRGIARISDGAV